MEKHNCAICESAFYTVDDAWGDRTCGDCIAAAVELGLIGLGARKPARRAVPPEEPLRVADVDRRIA